jgi:hypothetical protein
MACIPQRENQQELYQVRKVRNVNWLQQGGGKKRCNMRQLRVATVAFTLVYPGAGSQV